MNFKDGDKVRIISHFERCNPDIGTEGVIKSVTTNALIIDWIGFNYCLRCSGGMSCRTGSYNLKHIEKVNEHNRNGANS